MKKLILLLAVCLTLTMAACSANDTTDMVAQSSGEPTSEVTSGLTGGSAETTESAEKEESAVSDTTTSDPTESSSPVPSTSRNNSSAGENNGKTTNPPVTSSQAPKNPPATSTPTPSKPTPSEPAKPADPPVTSTPPVAFNPQPYIDYAIWYGESIGLIYEPRIGTGAWDSPLNLYAGLTDQQMKSNIEGRCRSIKNEGKTHFYAEAKPLSNGSYQLYIYYATAPS